MRINYQYTTFRSFDNEIQNKLNINFTKFCHTFSLSKNKMSSDIDKNALFLPFKSFLH